MPQQQSFLQLPPDSSGKRVQTTLHTIEGTSVHVPGHALRDAEDPTLGQRVDYQGQAFTRFAEGSPVMDSAGNLKTSQSVVIGVYDFSYDSADWLFSDNIVGGGSLTYDADFGMVALGVDAAVGSKISRTTNKYHFFWPGVGNLTVLNLAVSGPMLGCTRKWGLFDQRGGVYFNYNESGILGIEVSTSAPVPTSIFTPQSAWSEDKLDGTGKSGFILDVTKVNAYWGDTSGIEGGRLRLGVLDSAGNRIVCHSIPLVNVGVNPFFSFSSVPMRYEIENVTTTGGPSSLRVGLGSVRAQGNLSYTYWRYSYTHTSKTVSSADVPILALRSKPTWNNAHNVTNSYPELYSCVVTGGVVRLDIYWDAVGLTGATWLLDNSSTVVADDAATAAVVTGFYPNSTFYLDTGTHSIDLSRFFEINDSGLSSNADETPGDIICIMATMVSGTPTIVGALNYRELR